MRLPLRYNWRSLLQRRTRAGLTALGVAMAVFIAVLMLALARGLLDSTRQNGSPETVLVLSLGAETLEFSALAPDDLHRLASGLSAGADGHGPIVSAELFLSTMITFPDQVALGEQRGLMRGVSERSWQVHTRAHLTAGRLPERGFEVLAGRLAATKLGVPATALAIGQQLAAEGQTWTVVGEFEAPGTTLEAELWAPVAELLLASQRSDYSCALIRTADPQAAVNLAAALNARTDIRVWASNAAVYYARMAEALKPVQTVSLVMTVLLVSGALLVGMNTMFTAIAGRTREMGILLVLGYRRDAVLLSFIGESLLLSLAGGAVGCLASLALNDLPFRIPMGAFRFVVDGGTLFFGLALAAMIGFIGAAIPVWQVAKLPIISALRAN